MQSFMNCTRHLHADISFTISMMQEEEGSRPGRKRSLMALPVHQSSKHCQSSHEKGCAHNKLQDRLC